MMDEEETPFFIVFSNQIKGNMKNNIKILDFIGIGIGPSNLSLSSLAEPKNISFKCLERKKEFNWHSGMLFNDSELQVSYLKDLVTLVDPTSPYSFLAFLSSKGRIYNFLNANFQRVLRLEFNEYMKWAIDKIPQLEFGQNVVDVDFDGDKFIVKSKDGSINYAKHQRVSYHSHHSDTGAVFNMFLIVMPKD